MTLIGELPMVGGIDYPGRVLCLREGKIHRIYDGSDSSLPQERYRACGFYGEHLAFIDALAENKPIEDNVESSLQSVDIADHLRKRAPSYQ